MSDFTTLIFVQFLITVMQFVLVWIFGKSTKGQNCVKYIAMRQWFAGALNKMGESECQIK